MLHAALFLLVLAPPAAPWEVIDVQVTSSLSGAFTATGGVNMLFSNALFVDGFESGDTNGWSQSVP